MKCIHSNVTLSECPPIYIHMYRVTLALHSHLLAIERKFSETHTRARG